MHAGTSVADLKRQMLSRGPANGGYHNQGWRTLEKIVPRRSTLDCPLISDYGEAKQTNEVSHFISETAASLKLQRASKQRSPRPV
eukprot:scaffold68201_cov15-Tisochrysis_lutea.AAC.1